jgi:hypothetical protein
MSFRARIILMVLWVASLFTVGALAREQAFQMNPLAEPVIVSGDEIGFRVEGTLGGAPAGTLVIRRDGQWIEPRWKTVSRRIR